MTLRIFSIMTMVSIKVSRQILVYKQWSLLSLLIYLLTMFYTPTAIGGETIRGALCLLRADHKIVLIKEVLTQKLSLPGGTIEAGESPEQAAQRETWEETGLAVRVGALLGNTPTASVYECIGDSKLIKYRYINKLGGEVLPIWFAPDYGIETSEAMLIHPSRISASQYRFPTQWELIESFFSQATNQSTKMVNELIKVAPLLHQFELTWISSFQYWVASLPDPIELSIKGLSQVITGLASPLFGIVIFPWLYWQNGKFFCYKAFFSVALTSLLCLIVQQSFSLPGPYAYVPEMLKIPAYGFSFPNLPMAVGVSLVTLWLLERRPLEWNKATMACVIAMVGLFFAQLYAGSAFMSDMLIGGLIGLLVTWHIARFYSQPSVNINLLLCSSKVWFMLTLGAALLTYLWPKPVFLAWLLVLAVMSLMVMTNQKKPATITAWYSLLMIVCLLITSWLLSYAANFFSSSGVASLALYSVYYPILIFLFVVMLRVKHSCNKTA